MRIKESKGKKIWSFVLAMAMLIGIFPQISKKIRKKRRRKEMRIKKSKCKKIWSFILAMAMLIGILPQTAMSVQAAGEIYAVLTSEGLFEATSEDHTVATTTGITDKKAITNLFVASDVTEIEDNAFGWCRYLTTVEMPVVTSIGDSAFCGCTDLGTVTMPVVKKIGFNAFNGCKVLTTVEMREVTSIGKTAFLGCAALTTVETPVLETIDESAFSGCPFTIVTMPEVTSIGDNAFSWCTALTTVETPVVTSIGYSAFGNCTALTTVDMQAVETIDRFGFFRCTNLTTITMPGVTSIGECAFLHCAALGTVTIPKITLIGNYAFSGCTALANLTVGATPPTVGADPFSGCLGTHPLIIVDSTPEAIADYKKQGMDYSKTDDLWYKWSLSGKVSPPVTKTYNVSFSGGTDATGTASTQVPTVANGTFTLPSNPFTKTSYTFTGWNDGTKTYQIGATYTMPAKDVIFTAYWQKDAIPTYNVVYNANGGTGSIEPQITNVGTDTTLIANTFTRTDYTFKDWNTLADGKGTSYADSSNILSQTVGTTIMLYAQWTEDTFNATGNVVDDNDDKVTDATVQLMKGNMPIGAKETTDADGNFTIANVPNGTYNLVVRKGDITVTTIIVVSGEDKAAGIIKLPSGKTNSVVLVKPHTPQIVVGGLDEEFSKTVTDNDNGVTVSDNTVVTEGGSVEIKFTAEKKDKDAPNASDISATASSNGKTVGQFIDLSVLKTVKTKDGVITANNLNELPNLVEIFIPLDTELQDKTDYVIYRYHGTSVDTITKSTLTDVEKIEMIDSKTIKLSVNKFSTYAIAYKDTPTGGGTTGGGSTGRTTRRTTGGGSKHEFSEIEKLIIDLPSIEDFKEINLPEFEIVEIQYKKLTNDEKLVIDEFLHNKYKEIAALQIVKSMPKTSSVKKTTQNPKTGGGSPFVVPMMSTMGFALGALGLYLKGKGKQE